MNFKLKTAKTLSMGISKIIHTSLAPEPVGPYSQAIKVDRFCYLSGQIPLDAQTGELVLTSIEAQTKKVMENIGHVLKEAGLGFENIIKATIFLTSMDNFAAVNSVYSQSFKEAPPARSCVEVSKLPKNVDVEIEVVAFC